MHIVALGGAVTNRRFQDIGALYGMTQTEISEQLGQPLGTIKARIRRGVIKMKDILADWL